MASDNANSGLDHALERAEPVHGVDSGTLASQHLSPLIEQQRHGVKLQKHLFARLGGHLRPFVVGGLVGSPFLFVLSQIGGKFLWGSIEVPGIGLGTFVAIGSFLGSLTFGFTVNVARFVAPTIHHYCGLFEVWSKYRLGRIPPEQYFEHGAVLDYQRLYGQMPQHARPETQADFVRRVVQWRMTPKETPKIRRKRSPRKRGVKLLATERKRSVT